MTGEKALYCDQTYAVGIDGMTEAEAEPLLRLLGEHITQPALTCRLRWAPKALTMWDNRLAPGNRTAGSPGGASCSACCWRPAWCAAVRPTRL